MRIIDLSAPIEQSPPELPELLRTDISYADHAAGARDAAFHLKSRELMREARSLASH